ncbi:hypothetical protein EMIT079MI2_40187 [Bacillus sp. IT-79MI2]
MRKIKKLSLHTRKESRLDIINILKILMMSLPLPYAGITQIRS